MRTITLKTFAFLLICFGVCVCLWGCLGDRLAMYPRLGSNLWDSFCFCPFLVLRWQEDAIILFITTFFLINSHNGLLAHPSSFNVLIELSQGNLSSIWESREDVPLWCPERQSSGSTISLALSTGWVEGQLVWELKTLWWAWSPPPHGSHYKDLQYQSEFVSTQRTHDFRLLLSCSCI